MFSLFKKKQDKNNTEDDRLISVAGLLIHSAKIDQNFSDKEKEIIKKALLEMGAEPEHIENVILNAENMEKNSNHILNFTRTVKNLNEEEKKIIIEALWKVIYSDKNADVYETNLMRRLSGLLYLDNKVVGDLKEKVKKQNDLSG